MKTNWDVIKEQTAEQATKQVIDAYNQLTGQYSTGAQHVISEWLNRPARHQYTEIEVQFAKHWKYFFHIYALKRSKSILYGLRKTTNEKICAISLSEMGGPSICQFEVIQEGETVPIESIIYSLCGCAEYKRKPYTEFEKELAKVWADGWLDLYRDPQDCKLYLVNGEESDVCLFSEYFLQIGIGERVPLQYIIYS